jgi:hypothetical protein
MKSSKARLGAKGADEGAGISLFTIFITITVACHGNTQTMPTKWCAAGGATEKPMKTEKSGR